MPWLVGWLWWIVVPIFRFLEVVNSQSAACCDHSQAIPIFWRQKKLCHCRDFRSGNFANKFRIPANSMSRSPQPYLPLASHVSATPFSLQFVCLSLHRSQDFPTFTICWLQVLSFVLWHRILERPPQMPSWRSTALNRPTFLLQLFLVNFQRSWNCFLVNAMSSKLKAFSILAKKIREVYLGWSAGRQMLAIPCNFLARSIHRHFFPLLRLMSHSDHLLHAKNISCIFWKPANVLIKKMPNFK